MSLDGTNFLCLRTKVNVKSKTMSWIGGPEIINGLSTTPTRVAFPYLKYKFSFKTTTKKILFMGNVENAKVQLECLQLHCLTIVDLSLKSTWINVMSAILIILLF